MGRNRTGSDVPVDIEFNVEYKFGYCIKVKFRYFFEERN